MGHGCTLAFFLNALIPPTQTLIQHFVIADHLTDVTGFEQQITKHGLLYEQIITIKDRHMIKKH